MIEYKSLAIAFKRIVVSFLLGILLICNTACNERSVSTKSGVDYSNGKQEVGLLYSKSKKVKSLDNIDDFITPKKQQELLDPQKIPASNQPIINRANSRNQLLEKIKQMFKDAGNF